MFDMRRRIGRDERTNSRVGNPVRKTAPQDTVAAQALARHDEEAGFIPVRRPHNRAVQSGLGCRLCHIVQVDFGVDLDPSAPDALVLINVEALRDGLRGCRLASGDTQHAGEILPGRERFGAALALGPTAGRDRLCDMAPDFFLARS